MADQVFGLSDEAFITSTADRKGRITYANSALLKMSGYSEDELLGKPHSIMRHPDMPRGLFKLMWEALQREEEFHGYLKNRARDGTAFWSYTTTLPNRDGAGNVSGYFSLRRKPRAGAIETIAPMYDAMCKEERRAAGDAGVKASIALVKNVLAEKGMGYEQFILSLQK